MQGAAVPTSELLRAKQKWQWIQKWGLNKVSHRVHGQFLAFLKKHYAKGGERTGMVI